MRRCRAAYLMRFQPMRLPDLLHGTDGDAYRLGHRPGRPVGRCRRFLCRRFGHHLPNDRRRQRLLAGRSRLVTQQAIHALSGKPGLPAPHCRLGPPSLAHDLCRPHAICAQQHNLRPPHMLLRRHACRHQFLKPHPILRRKLDLLVGPHEYRLAHLAKLGNHPSRSEHWGRLVIRHMAARPADFGWPWCTRPLV